MKDLWKVIGKYLFVSFMVGASITTAARTILDDWYGDVIKD